MSQKERSKALTGVTLDAVMSGLATYHAVNNTGIAPEHNPEGAAAYQGELPITREKAIQPTTTSYEHTPAQNGQFGNYEHVVTTKDAEGHTVGHLAAQDTAPGEVTIRSNQIYDEAHRGMGKGTAAIRTLVDETSKNPSIKVIHSDITTTGAARGAWEKIADANPETVKKQDFNGVPRWTVDLEKVREKAANAPEFNGSERRGSTRGPLMSPTQIENNLKTGQPVSTPFDNTQGAMDTINRDLAKRLEQKATEEPKPTVIEPASQRLQDEAAEPIQVRHWSKQGVPLTETNPEKFGTGRAGAERARASEPGFLPRTYFGMEGYKEPAVQSGLEHNATLDKNDYYDKDADPRGIWKKGYAQGGATGAERAVKDAGYHGYYSPEQQVLASFNKVPVRVSELSDAAEISKLHNAEGGSTYNPRMGNMNGKDAFAVPAHPELSKVVAGTKIQPSDVEAYMKSPKVAEALAADPALSVGTWANEGKTYYDLSKTVLDRDQAIALGKKNNQIAIRDLKNNVDINTGGTGRAKREASVKSNAKPEKAAPKKAPKSKATEFNPADLSKNSAPSLTERMKNALS
jgi:hypothetical protein